MGKVITVMNMKGGVGKTTATMHLGGMSCRIAKADGSNRKILLIDYDPQFNLTQAYLPQTRYQPLEDARKTTLAILVDDHTKLDPYKLIVPGNIDPPDVTSLTTTIQKLGRGGQLDLVPSTLDLMYVALGQADTQIKPIEERFAKFIDQCRSKYDLTLIDCHPAGSLFTKTSLQNSDYVIIPVIPQRYSIRGIGLMMNFISSKKNGKTPATPYILFNHTHRTIISDEERTIRANPRYSNHCFTRTLKKYKAFADPEGGNHFVWSSGKPYSTAAYNNLYSVTSEFLSKVDS